MAARKSSGGLLPWLVIGGAGLAAFALSKKASAAGPIPTTGPATTPTPPTPRPPPRTTTVFDPAKAPDPTRAHDLAVSFGNSIDPTTGNTYPSIDAFGAVPSNKAALIEFQKSAGIDADGVVGAQTRAAFDYFYANG